MFILLREASDYTKRARLYEALLYNKDMILASSCELSKLLFIEEANQIALHATCHMPHAKCITMQNVPYHHMFQFHYMQLCNVTMNGPNKNGQII